MAESLYKSSVNTDFGKKLEFLVTLDKMKGVYRQTLLTDKSRRETDAEHSWHIAMMAMLFAELAPEGVDRDRCIRMCLVHDLIEIYAGDTFCFYQKGNEDKAQRESEAAEKLFAILPEKDGKELRELWMEFEEQSTPDAKFCASLDRLQPLVNNILTDGHTWRKGKVERAQVEKRMSVIEEGFPAAWETVKAIINEADDKGYFQNR